MTEPLLEVQLCAFGEPTRLFSIALPGERRHPVGWAEEALIEICHSLGPGLGCDFHGSRVRNFPQGTVMVARFSCFDPLEPDRASAAKLAPQALERLARLWRQNARAPLACPALESAIELETLEPLDRFFLAPPPDFMLSMHGVEALGEHATLPSTLEASMELSQGALALAQKALLALHAREPETSPPKPRL